MPVTVHKKVGANKDDDEKQEQNLGELMGLIGKMNKKINFLIALILASTIVSTAVNSFSADVNSDIAGVRGPNWRDPVASAASLPTTNNNLGDVRLAVDTFTFYAWDGNSWEESAASGVGIGGAVSGAATNSLLFSDGNGDLQADGTAAWDSTSGTFTLNYGGGMMADFAPYLFRFGDIDNAQGNAAANYWSFDINEGLGWNLADGGFFRWLWPTSADLVDGSILVLNANRLQFQPPYDTATAITSRVYADAALGIAYTYTDGIDPLDLGAGAQITANANGTFPAIDGITLSANDTVTLNGEVSEQYNGIYTLKDTGSVSTPWVLERLPAFDDPSEINNGVVVIAEGTVYATKVFAQTSEVGENAVGTDEIIFATPTNVNVTQSLTGTQTSGFIPFWTGNARELSRGVDYFKWTNSSRRLTVNGMMAMSSFNSSLTETENLFIGKNVGNTTHTGIRNQILSQTVLGLTSGNRNTGNGYRVLNPITSGSDNTAMGAQAAENISTTNESSFFGGTAGRYRNVSQLTAVGYSALRGSATVANNTGTGLVGVGYRAGQVVESAVNATFLGANAGRLNVSGDNMTVVGANAGDTITSGVGVTLVGSDADATGNYSRITAVGYAASIGADDSMCFGNECATNASNQLVFGSGTTAARDVYFGNGITNTTPAEVVISGTSESGTNQTGASIQIRAPLGTGTGTSGDIIFSSGNAGASGTTLNTASEKIRMKPTGILRGSAFHNNSLAQGSTTEQDIRSGTATPSCTAGTNASTCSVTKMNWMRVGNVVTWSALVNVDPTAGATFTRYQFALPVSSNFTALGDAIGSGASADGNAPRANTCYANTGSDVIQCDFISGSTAAEDQTVHGTYEVK